MVAVIMPRKPATPETPQEEAVTCRLTPAGDGTFITDLPIAATTADRLAPGQEVRLKDDYWPSPAQMVLIGRVVRVEETKDRDPLFRHVRVRPDLDADLSRIRSVILHIPVEDDANIRSLLSELPLQRLEAFNLVYIENKKYQQAADEMGISINSIKTHLKLAVKTLRKRFLR